MARDNPGSPSQPSRRESLQIAAAGSEHRPEKPEPVQDAKADGEQKQQSPEQAVQETRDDRQRDPSDQPSQPETEGADVRDRDDHQSGNGESPQSGEAPGDKSEQDADWTRVNDGSWAAPASERPEQRPIGDEAGIQAPEPGRDATNNAASTPSDRTINEPADATTDRDGPAPVERPTEPTEAEQAPEPWPRQEGDGAPAAPDAARDETESSDPGDRSSTPEPEQLEPDKLAEPRPPFLGAHHPDSIVGTRADGSLIRTGDTFAVRPGDELPGSTPDRTEDFGRPDLYDHAREGTREPDKEQEVPDVTEPDPETTDRGRRTGHGFFKRADELSDLTKKGGGKIGELLRSNPNKDVLPSTVRDTTSMADTDYTPLKGGDVVLGSIVATGMVYYGTRLGARMLLRKIRER